MLFQVFQPLLIYFLEHQFAFPTYPNPAIQLYTFAYPIFPAGYTNTLRYIFLSVFWPGCNVYNGSSVALMIRLGVFYLVTPTTLDRRCLSSP